VLDNGRTRPDTCNTTWNLFTLLFTRPTARTAGPVAQKEALFFCSLLFSISLVKSHTCLCREVFFYPFSLAQRGIPFLVACFVGCPPFHVAGSRESESQGFGTRRCLSLLRQPLFLPSALRLRRARRQEICCSSLLKFTRTRTWVSMCVKQPLYFYDGSLLGLPRLVRDKIVSGIIAEAFLADPALRPGYCRVREEEAIGSIQTAVQPESLCR
jgi:hypothetical protein